MIDSRGYLTVSSTPISNFTFVSEERNIIDKLNDRERLYNYDIKIKDATDKELVEEYIYLVKNAQDIQLKYELYVISHKDELKRYKKLFGGKKDLLKDSYSKCQHDFILETEVFDAIDDELIERGYKEYLEILWNRYIDDCVEIDIDK